MSGIAVPIMHEDSHTLMHVDSHTQVMYDKRSKLGLVGSSFDTTRADWSSRETTIGPGIDSYYEYLLKVRYKKLHVPC